MDLRSIIFSTFISSIVSKPLPLPSFHKKPGWCLAERNHINNICKRKKTKQCQVKKEPISPTPVGGNLYMDSVGACRMPMAVKCLPAEEQKAVINLLFLTNMVQKNKPILPEITPVKCIPSAFANAKAVFLVNCMPVLYLQIQN